MLSPANNHSTYNDTQMTINHDKKLTSFFNMPVKEVTGMRGKPDRVSEPVGQDLVMIPNSEILTS